MVENAIQEFVCQLISNSNPSNSMEVENLIVSLLQGDYLTKGCVIEILSACADYEFQLQRKLSYEVVSNFLKSVDSYVSVAALQCLIACFIEVDKTEVIKEALKGSHSKVLTLILEKRGILSPPKKEIPESSYLEDVGQEYQVQARKWGRSHDQNHTVNDWSALITQRLGKLTSESSWESRYLALISIAALCVSACEALSDD